MNDPLGLADRLQFLYLQYLDSVLPLRGAALAAERRRLFQRPGALFQEPRLELLPPYPQTDTLAEVCEQLHLSPEFADFACHGLFPAARRLYAHQREALQVVVNDHRHMVVITGTSSGKTECFLLPVFEYLVRELVLDPQLPRRRAVRALVLYPLNAFVEDQMIRLRQAADSVDNPDTGQPGARTWLDSQRPGLRFYFGRYTGRTPVSGYRTKSKKTELGQRRTELQRQARQVAADLRLRYQFPSVPDRASTEVSGECWDRWAMQDSPPDILVTNYSMLNIMLMREMENNIFEQTKQWLAADRERHVFHLVVDELHSYRGTQGTEVAYLIRLLLHRLDLEPDSPQVRFLASSASLDETDKASQTYLEAFFGVPWSSGQFAMISGQLPETRPEKLMALRGRAGAFLPFHQEWQGSARDAADRLASRLEVPPSTEPVPELAP